MMPDKTKRKVLPKGRAALVTNTSKKPASPHDGMSTKDSDTMIAKIDRGELMRTTYYLKRDIAKRLKLIAVERDIPLYALLGNILDEWLAKNDKGRAT